ncbi:hypothetical protein [Gordonia hankookensis]|uniref:Uncharacterized protein n=1 Tax=Gordonia hankookensis TaxID=589403 RepID=A0ABR7WB49_9ACTN|nr:hypothetical protein [Gordonia hankookensis]NDZ93575.1 hypothetical protein [Streptomyces sp. SID11726]NEB27359.1 hypothetical protein [Streptomyces sp. SID6673]
MVSPDPAERPKLVVWAYRCWTVSGGLLVALGVLFIVLGIVSSGPTLLPIGVGIIVAVIGVCYFLIGSKAFVGDARWRSSLSALTLVVVIMLLIVSFGLPILAFALVAALVGLFGSLLAYRPESEAWYAATNPPKPSKK